MSVLITGAAGLVGRRLVENLEASTEVHALTRGAAPARGPAHWISADLTSPDITRQLPNRVDTVVHLAQSMHYQEFPARAVDIFDVNVASTARLLEWSRSAGVRRFVLASAGGADRAGPSSQLGFYLATRRSAELLALGYRDHLIVTVLRFFFVYGAGQRPTMLIPRLIDSVRAGRAITLAGANGLRLNPVHVDDAAAAVARATQIDHQGIVDIAGPDVLSLRQIGDTIGRTLDRRPLYAVDDRAEPADLVGDITAMTEHLGAPVRPFDSGVEDVVRGQAEPPP